MKTVKKKTLYFKSGRSDKVYEVELFDVGGGRYVVNFRYGRRGTSLREGTKTTAPVMLDKAEWLFDELIASKTAKGYTETLDEAHEQPEAIGSEAPREGDDVSNPMHRAVLARLAAGRSSSASRWRLSRAAWRAGEIGIAAASPLLMKLIGSGDEMLTYSAVWAISRCGHPEAGERLKQLLRDTSTSSKIRRVATAALFALSSAQERQESSVKALSLLPASLRDFAGAGDAAAFGAQLKTQLEAGDAQAFAVLEQLYFIDNPTVRRALLAFLETAPFERNYFKRIRYLFKASEMLGDGEVFGVIARRFETAPVRYHAFGEDKTYGKQTRQYLIRRCWRTLSRFGELGRSDYVEMATGVLLAFTDDDAASPHVRVGYTWTRETGYRQIDTHYDSYCRFFVFNQILYANSPRYRLDAGMFACIAPYVPGDDEPSVREEAFPELWTAAPEALLALLKKSRCRPVHHFAVKAIRTCKDFISDLETADVAVLLQADYDVTASLGFDIAMTKYNADAPDISLIVAAANCRLDKVRVLARTWLERHRMLIAGEGDALLALLTSPYADTRAHAVTQLRLSPLGHQETTVLMGRVMALLMSFGEGNDRRASEIAEVLLSAFSEQLRNVDETVLTDMMAHPLPAVQRLAGELILRHSRFSSNPPAELLRALIASSESTVREIGVRILGQLPEHLLRGNRAVLVAMTCHPLQDVRETVRPIVRRLSVGDSTFARGLVSELLSALLSPKMPKGVPSHIVRVLREDLTDALRDVPSEMVWRLLKSRSPVAQELGGFLLPTNVNQTALSMPQIVQLANHEILSVREAAWAACRADLYRLKREMDQTIRLLDARFEDTRRFAMMLFEKELADEPLTPTQLVGLCDSVRQDIQQFGKILITRRFEDEQGEAYLLKLSEHPSAALQEFATHYLERYASDNAAHLERLMPYFTTVLAKVNKSRVAKDRILGFLRSEALKSKEAAGLVSNLLGRQSVTCAIGDKATLIEAMVAISHVYPDIDLPVELKETEVRGGV